MDSTKINFCSYCYVRGNQFVCFVKWWIIILKVTTRSLDVVHSVMLFCSQPLAFSSDQSGYSSLVSVNWLHLWTLHWQWNQTAGEGLESVFLQSCRLSTIGQLEQLFRIPSHLGLLVGLWTWHLFGDFVHGNYPIQSTCAVSVCEACSWRKLRLTTTPTAFFSMGVFFIRMWWKGCWAWRWS